MKYPGGKGQTFQKSINLMPPHDVYIETHLGGGAVIRNKKPARRNIGLEIDPKVIETNLPGLVNNVSPVLIAISVPFAALSLCLRHLLSVVKFQGVLLALR